MYSFFRQPHYHACNHRILKQGLSETERTKYREEGTISWEKTEALSYESVDSYAL